jgi:hypothetical protein
LSATSIGAAHAMWMVELGQTPARRGVVTTVSATHGHSFDWVSGEDFSVSPPGVCSLGSCHLEARPLFAAPVCRVLPSVI